MAKIIFRLFITILILMQLPLGGCGLSPAKKPDIGPAGTPTESKSNPPWMERFEAAPSQLYDLEAIAATTFDGINKQNWPQAKEGLSNLQATWQETKQLVGDMKGVSQGDSALAKLSTSIIAEDRNASYEALNKFMSSTVDIGKSYKLSPVSDIISLGSAIRNVSFYVQENNWPKAKSKAKEFEDNWGQIKPALEQIGILGEITKTHSFIRQLSDAVDAENAGAATDLIGDLNDSMGRIREYYRGK